MYTADWNSIKLSAAYTYTWMESAAASGFFRPGFCDIDNPLSDERNVCVGDVNTLDDLHQIGGSILHKPSGLGIFGQYTHEATGGGDEFFGFANGLVDRGFDIDEENFLRISNPETNTWYVKPFLSGRKVWGSMNGVGLGSLGATTLYGEYRDNIEGLLIAILDIDEVIQLIRTSDDAAVAKARLMDVFDLSELQATYILDLQLRRLTKFSRVELEAEQAELQRQIEALRAILGDEKLLLKTVSTELGEVAKAHGTPRRTVLLESAGTPLTTATPMEVVDDPCWVLLSSTGLMARTTSDDPLSGEGGRHKHDAVVAAVRTTARGSRRPGHLTRADGAPLGAGAADPAADQRRPQPVRRRARSPRSWTCRAARSR